MATYDLRGYRKIQQARANHLKRGIRKGPITSAKYMVSRMRNMAPRDTGRVLGSIKRREASVEVRGSNPYNGFPYIHWLNATPGSGLERVAYKARYGDFRKYSYAAVPNKTGTPGFYFIAAKDARRFFIKAMHSVTKATLRADF